MKNENVKEKKTKKETKKKVRTKGTKQEEEIKRDILNGVSKDEIMAKNDISLRSYTRRKADVRQLMLERTLESNQKIVDEVFPDMDEILKNINVAKRNSAIRIIKEVNNKENNSKELKNLENKLNLIVKVEKVLKTTSGKLNNFDLLQVSEQLANEEMQLEKLEIEKSKLDDNSDKKEMSIEFSFKNDTKIEELEEK